jgi:ABC-type Fe3+ transport system permease subunit
MSEVMDFRIRVFDPEVLAALRLTLLWSGVALLPAYASAMALASITRGRGLRPLRGLAVLPGMFYAWVVLVLLRRFAPDFRFSMVAVALAWVFAGIPYLAVAFSEGIGDLDPRNREAMMSLGASRFRLWWHHDFLQTLPVQASALLQQLWSILTSFSIVMILGGGPPHETLEVGVYTSMRLDRVDPDLAAALAFWQALILVSLRVAIRRFRSGPVTGFSPRHAGERSGRSLVMAGVWMSGLVLLLVTRPDPQEWIRPLLTSVVLAFLSSTGALLLAWGAYFSGLRMFAEIGAWVSPMVLSWVFWSVSIHWNLGSLPVLVIIQSILFSPWFARTVFPLLDRKRTSELEAARLLGAHAVGAWIRVEWPRVRGPVLSVAGWVAALSVMEVSSVMWFSRGDFDTLSSWVQNLFLRFRIDEAGVGFAILGLLAYAFLGLTEKGGK